MSCADKQDAMFQYLYCKKRLKDLRSMYQPSVLRKFVIFIRIYILQKCNQVQRNNFACREEQ